MRLSVGYRWWAISILLAFSVVTWAQMDQPVHKIVYHINFANPVQQRNALRNIQAHLNSVEKGSLDLIVVLHGRGLSMLLYPSAAENLRSLDPGNANEVMQAQIDGLRNQGIHFRVCATSARLRNIEITEHLYNVDEADIIYSGVAELAKLQMAGYTYIKP